MQFLTLMKIEMLIIFLKFKLSSRCNFVFGNFFWACIWRIVVKVENYTGRNRLKTENCKVKSFLCSTPPVRWSLKKLLKKFFKINCWHFFDNSLIASVSTGSNKKHELWWEADWSNSTFAFWQLIFQPPLVLAI